MSMRSKSREPAVGRSRSRKSLARVVFPDPDSPTMPSVSPSATCTLTPSTALMNPRTRPTVKPAVTGKYSVSPIPCSISDQRRGQRPRDLTEGATPYRDGGSHPAGSQVTVLHGDRGRERLRPRHTKGAGRGAPRRPGGRWALCERRQIRGGDGRAQWGGGSVGNQRRGRAGGREGARPPRPPPATELMRVVSEPRVRGGD